MGLQGVNARDRNTMTTTIGRGIPERRVADPIMNTCGTCTNESGVPLSSHPSDLDEYTQVEPSAEGGAEGADVSAEPAPWGRLIRLSGGSAIPLMPRPEQAQGRALNEVTLGRRKASCERGR